MNDNKTGYDDRVQTGKPGTDDRVQADEPATGPSKQTGEPGTSPVFPGAYEPLTSDEISALAARDKKPDQEMSSIDWLLWYMLRDIYQGFKRGILDRETGAERKKEALDIWERQNAKDQRDRETINRAVLLWRTVEEAASEYTKNRTLENADRVMTAIYGIPCGPSSGS